jgi:putative endonuclease
MAAAGFLFILRGRLWGIGAGTMPIFSRMMFRAVQWAARRGLREEESFSSDSGAKKLEARRTGVRGETYAYWYLRRQGYIFVARNYTPRGIKGEIDLVGYDGKTLAFVEVRTRTIREDLPALPELSVTREKQHVVVRTAQRFLAERHVGECPCRFDVMAIDNCPGRPPVARLHKDAFSPQM